MLLYVLRFKPVQSYIAHKVTAYLSKELHTTISIKGLYIVPFKTLVVDDLLVLDLQKDTLAHIPQLNLDLKQLSTKARILQVNKLEVENASFFIKDQVDKSTNLDFIIDYFDKPGKKTVTSKKKQFEIEFNRIKLSNTKVKYKNLRHIHPSKGINFEDIDVTNFNADIENLRNNAGHKLKLDIKKLSLHEKSGFTLNELSGQTIIDSNAIQIENLLILTDRTRIRDFYRMDFSSFKDFKDYEEKVRMTANFKDSHISSYDIAFFAPALKKMRLDIELDGKIKGPVTSLRAKDLLIKAGNATYIKGDFSMKGLPDWKQTFMDLKIDLASTNKKDLEGILTDISGQSVKKVPKIIDKFGNINFNGYFTGFQDDFIAFGEFKTSIGRLKSDVNMKLSSSGQPSYTGSLQTYDFDLGKLLGQNLLGKISSSLNIKGQGVELANLKEELKGDITSIDFKGYRYKNVKINGAFEKKFFDGNLNINDKNVQLDFDGAINFNHQVPLVQFKANLKNADLKTLNLYKDSLIVDANFNTNFSGNSLDNIQGQLTLQHIAIHSVSEKFHIDSIYLKADGFGTLRSLSLKSDLLEGSIKGQYDLKTLVPYLKQVSKKYIPSLTRKSESFKAQNFDFIIKIKRFEPIAKIFIPNLSLSDQSVLSGNLNSNTQTANLGAYFKAISYKGIIANNVIIDENTGSEQLTAIITSDRIDINDSLFIQNVNLSNIIRNDSLKLNVKLSNSNDINQLDLNGLVEFFTDTTKISILPSNLRINNEDWQIQDKVQIGFNEGKTTIHGFALSQGKQVLTLEGAISDKASDVLSLGLANFKLKNLDPLVKTAKINLQGYANGKTNISSLLKTPQINNQLTLDSLGISNIYIGTLTDSSSYLSNEKKVNLYTSIWTNQKQTLNLAGFIDLQKEQIEAELQMDETKLAILSPFLSHLISNPKGSVSAKVAISGSLKNPNSEGYLKLNKAQLMVNYLRTTYQIDDQLGVKNGALELNNFVLSDTEGHKAIANGYVDLKNINNPNIQVDINAQGIMALNTTSKDNSLYYGRAYGTGRFSFKGPTNDMFIDIDAKTEKGTIFNLPLNSSEKISDKEFITFVGKDTTKVINKKSSFKGLSMNFKLRVDPNTTANIYTVLGKLNGTGNAELELNISKVGDFEMKGDYNIENGAFDFSARDIINKKFEIKQGGNIRWTGNPFNAQINLKAIYALRASLTELYQAANKEASNNVAQSTQTEVEMGLSGLLMKPDIKLDISFPANPAIKEDLQTYLNDGNNLYTQALSLIIQRRFAPGTGSDLSQQLSAAGAGTASDLFFNQLNNVFSNLNLNFVDINIRSLNEANASFKFFNDRIIVNAGITDVNKSIADNTIGSRNEVGREVEILALIKKDGSLLAKIANKPPTIQSVFLNPGVDPYKNIMSIGITYNQQFDSFGEFLRKITGKEKQSGKQPIATSQNKQNKEAVKEENTPISKQTSK